MRILGLIPARGGSKGIPRKNIFPVAGKPLLAWTCEAALASKSLSRVVLSTDDEEIAEVGRAWGVEVPFLRPAELATDTATSVDVALHALDWLEEHEGWHAEVIVLLQPTSPLRTATHIDEAVAVFNVAAADTVVSVVPVRHNLSPFTLMRLENGRLYDFWDQPLPFDRYRRQETPPLFARNGPALLVTRAQTLRCRKSFYGDFVAAYVMTEEESLDIDTPADLALAEWRLARRRGASCAG